MLRCLKREGRGDATMFQERGFLVVVIAWPDFRVRQHLQPAIVSLQIFGMTLK